MKTSDLLLLVIAAGGVFAVGLLLAKRTAPGSTSSAGYVPAGYTWNKAWGAYTKLMPDGSVGVWRRDGD